jgi:hypothetical protein
MRFSSSDFWVFKTLCGLWFIGLCGFLSVFMAFLVAMPSASLFPPFSFWSVVAFSTSDYKSRANRGGQNLIRSVKYLPCSFE